MQKTGIDLGNPQELLLGIVQLIVLYNAQQEGWEIKHLFGRTFEFSRFWNQPFPFEIEDTLDKIVPSPAEVDTIRDSLTNSSQK